MKTVIMAVMAATSLSAFAEENGGVETETRKAPIVHGFGNFGIYSGYQLYGSLLNSEPTLQGYGEINANLLVKDLDLGYLGVGVWCNTDLTGRRVKVGVPRRAFNEFDWNIHWGRTFWLDDDNTIGIDYRTSFVWYWYPHTGESGVNGKSATTMDWNHSFALVNPIVVPYLTVVHEYHESNGNLLQGGLRRTFTFDGVEGLSLTPFAELVWRNSHYNWCFPTAFGAANQGSGIATLKLELDGTYMFNDYIGLFAKFAFCSIIDPDLRENCDEVLGATDYGDKKEFVWGGVGVCVNF